MDPQQPRARQRRERCVPLVVREHHSPARPVVAVERGSATGRMERVRVRHPVDLLQIALQAAEAVVQLGDQHHRIGRGVDERPGEITADARVEHVEDAPHGRLRRVQLRRVCRERVERVRDDVRRLGLARGHRAVRACARVQVLQVRAVEASRDHAAVAVPRETERAQAVQPVRRALVAAGLGAGRRCYEGRYGGRAAALCLERDEEAFHEVVCEADQRPVYGGLGIGSGGQPGARAGQDLAERAVFGGGGAVAGGVEGERWEESVQDDADEVALPRWLGTVFVDAAEEFVKADGTGWGSVCHVVVLVVVFVGVFVEVVEFGEGGFTSNVSVASSGSSGGIRGVAQDDISGFAVVENAMVQECRFGDVARVGKGREE